MENSFRKYNLVLIITTLSPQYILMPVLTHSTGEGEGWWLYTVNAPTTWCFSFGCWLVCREGAPASEGIAVEEPKQWCLICNQPDNDDAPCRCDYLTQAELVELFRL